MAFGGGTWTAQNKILPGTYINTVSVASYNGNYGDRGRVACPIQLDWGVDTGVFGVTVDDFSKNAHKIFGYDATAPELIDVREVFKHATRAYFYRLNGGGTKSSNTFANAKYAGTYGNKIAIKIVASSETEGAFIVTTIVDGVEEDEQTVTASTGLVANDWVTWKTFELEATASTPLTGGANASTVTGANHLAALTAFESYRFDALVCPVDDAATIAVYTAYTKRLVEELGIKFQLITKAGETGADNEYITEVKNTCNDDNRAHALVYWVAGAQAGCALNNSCTGMVYDGEHDINTNFTQAQLEVFSQTGVFAFHRTDDVVRVLRDVNSFVTYTDEKGKAFGLNQTMRVLNYLATADGALFNENYIGVYLNTQTARSKLRSDLVAIRTALAANGAIGPYDASAMTVEASATDAQGVVMNDAITIAQTMERLYITEVIG